MPAGGHAILDQTRQAVERRARALLAQLQNLGDDPIATTVDEERTVLAEDDEIARSELG